LKCNVLIISIIITIFNNRSLVGLGYTWTITFETNVGPQPGMVINPLQLDNYIGITTTTLGVAPDNYQSKVVLSNSSSVEFLALSAGVTYYFRVLASNDIGDSLLSGVSEAVPASSPLAPSFLSIEVSYAYSIH
jgi:hypothetical protein